jgi:hypothetical protein
LAIAALIAAFFVVHDVPRWLAAPYFLDEAWVALSTRVAWSDLPLVSASTPLGWTVALRLVSAPQQLRLLPLFFHVAAVVVAYVLGRNLGWPDRLAARLGGLAAGATVLLLPAQQLRHDLKQYSADAAVTLALLALAAWTEAGWSRRRLGLTSAAVPAGLLFSHTTALAGAAVFTSFVVVAALRRRWRMCVDAVAAGGVALVGGAIVYVGVSARGRTSALNDYWAPFFPRITALPSYLVGHASALLPVIGVPAVVAAAAVCAGLITIVRTGRPMLFGALVLLPVIAITLGLLRVYPVLDLRTSHFLLTAFAAVGGVGLAGVAVALRRLPLTPRARGLIPVAFVVAGLVGYLAANTDWYRFDGTVAPASVAYPPATEDVRTEVEYVRAHRGADDIVLVNEAARWGVVFYWDDRPVRVVADPATAIGWVPVLPASAHMVVADDRTQGAVTAAVRRAVADAHAAGHVRVWVILSHAGSERSLWQQALAPYHVVDVGGMVEPVGLIQDLS